MILADARHLPIADGVVQMVCTSPPYFGHRDYATAGQIGLEDTTVEYIANLVAVFREVRRVLRPDGTVWLNLGDSYAGSWGAQSRKHAGKHAPNVSALSANQVKAAGLRERRTGTLARTPGCKNKDLVGIPWAVAFALRDDGWYLRADIIWAKPNGMPSSVKDRVTLSHEYVFLLSKNRRYYYDQEAIRTRLADSTLREIADGYRGQATKLFETHGVQNASDVKRRIIAGKRDKQRGHTRQHAGFNDRWDAMPKPEQQAQGANARSVWVIPPANYDGEHYAVMPDAVARRCILAGSRPGDVVLDPFLGTGTVAAEAIRLGRIGVGCDLQSNYLPDQRERLAVTRGLPLEISA
jgi:site-specific DNA-methyltransferase (cytosine-N4-specific)